ncbi:hypothetical protein [Corynebacterium sp.]|uniref:hypothetical protein n=1 Tax=Corynebacterium sp. TaxID=1720 RepID=UPI0026DB37BA|nr:hypothetical protein [Corynebacterium sp.]MDO4610419.1 hypothetical protein [Corynebacterium sp.]
MAQRRPIETEGHVPAAVQDDGPRQVAVTPDQRGVPVVHDDAVDSIEAPVRVERTAEAIRRQVLEGEADGRLETAPVDAIAKTCIPCTVHAEHYSTDADTGRPFDRSASNP